MSAAATPKAAPGPKGASPRDWMEADTSSARPGHGEEAEHER
jgi:hypothetical protein